MTQSELLEIIEEILNLPAESAINKVTRIKQRIQEYKEGGN